MEVDAPAAGAHRDGKRGGRFVPLMLHRLCTAYLPYKLYCLRIIQVYHDVPLKLYCLSTALCTAFVPLMLHRLCTTGDVSLMYR